VPLSAALRADYVAGVQINVNGQVYSRWEDVPAEVRQQLAATLPDHDRNGIPDLLEGNLSGLPLGGAQAMGAMSVNGQSFGSVSELPPEMQEVLRRAFGWPAPGTPSAPGTPPPPATGLQPGQVMLNGVPTSTTDAVEPRKPWWKRLFF
jgi:hypothetical protein